jgi:GrpB-like predicted nucleotidyltransferase (UPF0157 family)
MSRTVVVVDYDPGWPRAFEELRDSVSDVVSDIAIAIEHVGSTSVPGLAAKPVIDLDVVVAEDNVALAIERLSKLGYVHRGDLGIPAREAFRRPTGSRPHNLYVCPSGSPALVNHLALRDYLRANPEAAAEYGALKKKLAETFRHDIDGYLEGKTAFILGILESMGLTRDALSDIERMNRRPVEHPDSAA